MEEEKKETVYEVRCPICGAIYTYKIDAVKYDDEYPIGFTECGTCHQHVQHTLAYIKEDEE